jgi:PPOX class probable F420-dependent enzyme
MSAAQFSGHEYLNLETYRKTGEPVRTPVWFTMDGDRIFVVTKSETGKVKRLRNNGNVRIMPCGAMGQPKGEWVPASARFATPEEQETALRQRNKKYGIKAKLAGLFSSTKGDLVAITILPGN